MATVTVLYWRDIPAQVIAGKGRRAVKVPLPDRFERAIGFAAKTGDAVSADTYLAEWRKGPAHEVEGDDEAAAQAEAARIEAEYDMPRLKAMIATGGRDV